MKRKLLSMLLAVSLVCGVTACGGAGSKAATVTFEDNTYDLSGDFQEVVGEMVANGSNVVYLFSGIDYMLYDEDGKLVKAEDMDIEEPILYAIERHVTGSPKLLELEDEVGTLVYKQYLFMGDNIDFESKLGISNDTSKSDMKELDMFVDSTYIRFKNSNGYVAVFVDGELVNFDDYEEALEEWIDDCDDDGFAKSCEKNLDSEHYAKIGNRMLAADFVRVAQDFDEVEEFMKSVNVSAEDEMLLALVMQDAFEKLEDGDAKSVVTIKVEIADKDDDKDAIMEYTEYYFTDDWDQEKFKKED